MRTRIKDHRKVRVGDLLAHELNPRVHSDDQRETLQALLGEIGYARSVLAFELPDGRLKLIDGHLRQKEIDPDFLIDVEVLDVNEEEARQLLLSIDPLAQLAGYDRETLEQLRAVTESDNATLDAFWSEIQKQDQATLRQMEEATRRDLALREQFLVLIECASEQEQTVLLRRFHKEGLKCKSLTS